MRLALAQMNTVVGDLDGNRDRIVARLEEAREAGAELVLFPELAVTGYPPEDLLLRSGFVRAAAHSLGEILAKQLEGHIPVFIFSPGLVRTQLTAWAPDDAPWTPSELAPRLVRVLASGRADALAGRYLHAEHDDIEELIGRAGEIVENDLNAIRLRR